MTLKMKLTSMTVAVALSACSTALEPAADAATEQPPAAETQASETENRSTVEQPDCRVPSPPMVAC
jgi:hypothetical protein